VNPEASNRTIADRVDCAQSYTGQVIDDKTDIVAQIETRWNNGDIIKEILTDELSPSDINKLENSGRLASVDVQLPDGTDTEPDAPEEETDIAAETDVSVASNRNSVDDELATIETVTDGGDPTDNHGVMRAAHRDSDLVSTEATATEDVVDEEPTPATDQGDRQQQQLLTDSTSEPDTENESESTAGPVPDCENGADEDLSATGSTADRSVDPTAVPRDDTAGSVGDIGSEARAAAAAGFDETERSTADTATRITAVQASITTLRKALASPMYAGVNEDESPELLVVLC